MDRGGSGPLKSGARNNRDNSRGKVKKAKTKEARISAPPLFFLPNESSLYRWRCLFLKLKVHLVIGIDIHCHSAAIGQTPEQ